MLDVARYMVSDCGQYSCWLATMHFRPELLIFTILVYEIAEVLIIQSSNRARK